MRQEGYIKYSVLYDSSLIKSKSQRLFDWQDQYFAITDLSTFNNIEYDPHEKTIQISTGTTYLCCQYLNRNYDMKRLCLTVDIRDPSYAPVKGNEHPHNVTLWGSAPVMESMIIIYYYYDMKY